MNTRLSFGNGRIISAYKLLLFFFVVISIFNSSVLPFGKIYNAYCFFCIFSCIYFLIRSKRITRKFLRVYGWIVVIFAISAYFTNNLTMVVFALLIVAAERDFRGIVSTVFKGTLVGLSIVILLALIKVIPDYTYDHLGRTAHGLGFYYYAAIPYHLLFLSLMFIYLRGDRISRSEVVILFLIQVISYSFFTVRLTFYIGIIIIALLLIIIKWDFGNLDRKPVRIFSIMLFPVLGITSVVSCIVFRTDSPVWSKINSLLSNRLLLGNYALKNYSITLFGQQIAMTGRASLTLGLTSGSYFYIDSGYVYSVLVYGVLLSIVLFFMYTILMNRICRKNEKQLYVWLVAVLIFSIMNNALININMNPLLLSIPSLLEFEKDAQTDN